MVVSHATRPIFAMIWRKWCACAGDFFFIWVYSPPRAYPHSANGQPHLGELSVIDTLTFRITVR